MENYVTAQLAVFFQSALLGLLSGCLYDLLRAVRLCRRHSRWLMHLTDALYTLVLLLGMWLFALRLGQGELRLYMLAAMGLGGALYFLLLSRILRPMWDFWVHAAAGFAKLLWYPVEIAIRFVKKVEKRAKKLFYFWGKYATIKKYKWDCPHLGVKERGKGGGRNHGTQKKRKKARRHRNAGGTAADRRSGV